MAVELKGQIDLDIVQFPKIFRPLQTWDSLRHNLPYCAWQTPLALSMGSSCPSQYQALLEDPLNDQTHSASVQNHLSKINNILKQFKKLEMTFKKIK